MDQKPASPNPGGQPPAPVNQPPSSVPPAPKPPVLSEPKPIEDRPLVPPTPANGGLRPPGEEKKEEPKKVVDNQPVSIKKENGKPAAIKPEVEEVEKIETPPVPVPAPPKPEESKPAVDSDKKPPMPEPDSKGRPWGANPAQALSDNKPLTGQPDKPAPAHGTPWDPKKADSKAAKIELPDIQMERPKPAAMNFNGNNPAKDLPLKKVDQKPVKKKGGFGKKIIRLVLILLPFLLIGGAAAFAYGVTYAGFTLNQPEIETKIRDFILELPFAPKTPDYVVSKSVEAMSLVKSSEYTVSLAVDYDLPELTEMFGSDKFEFEISGDGEQGPDGTWVGSAEVNMMGELELDLRSTGEKLYVKIDTLFPTLINALGTMDPSQAMMFQQLVERRWFYFDLTGLKTSAGDLLDQQVQGEDFLTTLNLSEAMIEKMEQAAVMSEEELSGVPVQVIEINPSDELTEEIMLALLEQSAPEQPADYQVYETAQSVKIKGLKIKSYFDPDYRLRQASVSFKIVAENELLSSTESNSVEIGVAMMVEFDNFNKKIVVVEPPEAPSYLEFLDQLSAYFTEVAYLNQAVYPMTLGVFDVQLPAEI